MDAEIVAENGCGEDGRVGNNNEDEDGGNQQENLRCVDGDSSIDQNPYRIDRNTTKPNDKGLDNDDDDDNDGMEDPDSWLNESLSSPEKAFSPSKVITETEIITENGCGEDDGGGYHNKDENGGDQQENLHCVDGDSSIDQNPYRIDRNTMEPNDKGFENDEDDNDGMEDPDSWLNESLSSPETALSPASELLSVPSPSELPAPVDDTDTKSNKQTSKILSTATDKERFTIEKKDFKLRSNSQYNAVGAVAVYSTGVLVTHRPAILSKPNEQEMQNLSDEKQISQDNGVSVVVSRDVASSYMASLKSPKRVVPGRNSPAEGNDDTIRIKADVSNSTPSNKQNKPRRNQRRNRRDYDSDDDDYKDYKDKTETSNTAGKNIEVKSNAADLSCEKPTHRMRSRRNRRTHNDNRNEDIMKLSGADEKSVSFKTGTNFKSDSTHRMKSRMNRRRNRRGFDSSDEDEGADDEDDDFSSNLDGNSTHSQYSHGEATRATIDSELYNAVGAVAVNSRGVQPQRPAILTKPNEQEMQQHQDEVESQNPPTIDSEVYARKDIGITKALDRSIPSGEDYSSGRLQNNVDPSIAAVELLDSRVTTVSNKGRSDTEKKKFIDIIFRDEEEQEKAVYPWYQRPIFWIMIVALVVAIGVAVFLLVFYDTGSKPIVRSEIPTMTPGDLILPSEIPTTTPDVVPNLESFNATKSEAFIKYVIEEGGVSKSIRESTPQYDAFEWLMLEDELTVFSESMSEAEIEFMKTRYILAVFCYAFDLKSQKGYGYWLDSTRHHRFWQGVNYRIDGNSSNIGDAVTELRFNSLFGSIPSELVHLSKLEGLLITSSSLQNHKNLFNITSLKNLALVDTLYSGTLPVMIRRLSNLETLTLSNNQLSGTLTNHFQTMSKLNVLTLGRNNFEGTLDDILNCGNCTETLEMFHSVESRLSGSIPERLFKFSKLKNFTVFQSELSGTIPSGFGQLTALENLDLRGNGKFATNNVLPSEIGKMSNLKNFRLTSSTVMGTIPSEMQYLVKLENLEISYTELSGSIANEICNIDGLKRICHSSGLNCSCLDKCYLNCY